VPRLLYIVSRRNQQLYADLTRTSTGDRTVGVMLDRRHGERRQRAASSCRSPSERTALVEYRRTPPAAGLGSRGREVGCWRRDVSTRRTSLAAGFLLCRATSRPIASGTRLPPSDSSRARAPSTSKSNGSSATPRSSSQ